MEKRANKTKEHKNAFDVLVGAVFRVICAPKKKKKNGDMLIAVA